MKLSELETGMIVTLGSGDEYFVIRDGVSADGGTMSLICNADNVIPLENYDDDLRCVASCTPDGCLVGPLSNWWINAVSVIPIPTPFYELPVDTVIWRRHSDAVPNEPIYEISEVNE